MKKKGLKQQDEELEILKIPCIVTGFQWKKMAQEWDLTLTIQSENLDQVQPIQDEMGNHFVACFIKITPDIKDEMSRKGLKGIKIKP